MDILTAIDKFSRNKATSLAYYKYLNYVVDILNKKKEEFDLPPFVVAGGYLRDTILGLVPKDLDVFVDTTEDGLDSYVLYQGDILDENPFGEARNQYLRDQGETPPISFDVINTQFACPFMPFPPITQLIMKEFPSAPDLVEVFDYDTVKIYHDSTGTVITEEALNSLETQRVSVLNDRSKRFCTKAGWPTSDKKVEKKRGFVPFPKQTTRAYYKQFMS